MVSKITEKIINKPEGVSDLDVWNSIAGINVK
jgi:hypothetical protein